MELAVLAVRDKALDCRVLGDEDGREVVFRAAVKGMVPGEIVQGGPGEAMGVWRTGKH